MKQLRKDNGYVLALSLLMLLVFTITSFALFNSFLLDSKHQVATTQFDRYYFLAEGAKERGQSYFQHEMVYHHDSDTSNDPPAITINIDGISITVDIADSNK